MVFKSIIVYLFKFTLRGEDDTKRDPRLSEASIHPRSALKIFLRLLKLSAAPIVAANRVPCERSLRVRLNELVPYKSYSQPLSYYVRINITPQNILPR